MYQFSSYPGSLGTGYQFQLGFEAAGLSADAFYFKKYNAISVSALSAAQVTEVVNNCNADVAPPPPGTEAPKTIRCYSLSNSLSGTVSDNETYMVTALYNFGAVVPLKLYAGYEHIAFNNPTNPLPVGTVIIGGYQLAAVNVQEGAKSTYLNQKTLQVAWGGLKWSFTPDFELTVAGYGYKQNNYASTTAAIADCNKNKTLSGTCDGTLYAVSGLLDYKLTKRFDVYGGVFYNGVRDGLANGYYAKTNVATTLGARFKF
jgi:predicted porin